jgi:hypothetical protein
MEERHSRTIRSAGRTLLNNIKEVRILTTAGEGHYLNIDGRLTTEEAREIGSILSCMESAIKDYWHSSGFSNEEKNIKWQIFIMAQFMENLVCDIRPEHLNRTHGNIGSEEHAKKLENLCDGLDEQIRRLKEITTR